MSCFLWTDGRTDPLAEGQTPWRTDRPPGGRTDPLADGQTPWRTDRDTTYLEVPFHNFMNPPKKDNELRSE